MRIRIATAVVAGFVGVLTAGRPAWAQFGPSEPDLSGSWVPIPYEDQNERAGEGPLPADYTGIAFNDEGKALSLSTPLSRYSMIERQCELYPPHYLAVGPFGLKILAEVDPITGATIAYRIGAWQNRAETVIWMDGRPHPSVNAPHTNGGFETGQWRGNTLVTRTTHMKAGQIRRNAAQVSDQTTLTSYYIVHGGMLTLMTFIDDPVYLSEPQAVSRQFRMDHVNTVASVGTPCISAYEGTDLNSVPSYLPEKNPLIGDLKADFGIPGEAQPGGAETMYPEYRKKLKAIYVRPEKCLKYCGGSGPPLGGLGARGGGPPEGVGAPPGAPAPGAPPR